MQFIHHLKDYPKYADGRTDGRTDRQTAYMVGGPLLPVQGFGDEHLPIDGVYAVDVAGGLVGPGPGDAVANPHRHVLVRADLRNTRQQALPTGPRHQHRGAREHTEMHANTHTHQHKHTHAR